MCYMLLSQISLYPSDVRSMLDNYLFLLIIIITVYSNTVAITIFYVSFFLSLNVKLILELFGAFVGQTGLFFGAWVRFKNCSWVYSYELKSLISIGFTKPLFQNFLKLFWGMTDVRTNRPTDQWTKPPFKATSHHLKTICPTQCSNCKSMPVVQTWKLF